MNLYDRLLNGEEFISLIGLGYVGMPIAHAFAEKGINVIGTLVCMWRYGRRGYV